MASPSPARRRRGATPVDATTSTPSSSADAAATEPSFVPTALTTSYAPLAVAARNGSPAVLLGALALCFNGLVGGPKMRQAGLDADADSTAITTLAGLLGVATVVQVAASVVGLPPAGSVAAPAQDNDSSSSGGGGNSNSKKRKARKDVRKPNVIVTTTLSLVLTALATPLVHLVLVLFGAPFLAQTSRTLLCAAHLAVLGLYPVIYTRGTDGTGAWRALASGSQTARQLDAAVGGLWGACAGAWLGAVPIPLDWDRSWQQWPITVVVGIYLGHAVGRTLGGALQRR
ncbi:Glycosylphosphatidylinositol (GPI) anchor assembly protein [Sporothrix curviconia]|uniref:Glycosylphosphatidylinositol (GPI) anchor assembly protein n=1 Tax=Sporothrix curviconia TaxID=1260050 RepID=A0ABP0CAS8_9PEZI